MTQTISVPQEIADLFRHVEEKLILSAGYSSFEELDRVTEARDRGESPQRDDFSKRIQRNFGKIDNARSITPEVRRAIENYAGARAERAIFEEYVSLHCHLLSRFPELRKIERADEAYSLF